MRNAGDAPEDEPRFSPGERRAVVFGLLGPVLGVLIVFSLMIAATGGPSDLYGYPIVFFYSLIACAITALVDGVLAHVVPIYLRAPMTAIAGAVVAVGVVLLLWFGKMTPPPQTLILIAAVGALNTGACSLLTYCFRRRKA
jgi:hypothetical protein